MGCSVQCLLKRDGLLADTLDARHVVEDEKRERRNELRREDVANAYFKACQQGEHDESEIYSSTRKGVSAAAIDFSHVDLSPKAFLECIRSARVFASSNRKTAGV